ncbi:MAG: ATP-binding protein [Phycisphaerae bacterium]|nr:ATP-binding protein [Phycisphaerae bacterium]
MVTRDLTDRLKAAAKAFPAVTLTGPRQSGKSTLCRAVFPRHAYANLETPDIRSFAASDPRGFLAQYPHGAVLDEVQRCPELPSYLQGLIDQDPSPGKWILTGSQNLTLLESVSQSLAGRTAVLHLLPLARSEVRRFPGHPKDLDEVMLSGGYPRIFNEKLSPAEWLGAYVGTYLERDVRSISRVGDLVTFQRFVELCAGRTAQLLNLSGLASDVGIAQPTVKAWLSVLEASFIVFRLPPLHANIRKRLVKMPKLHFYDTGLACWLLGIRTADQLRRHPLRGAIFETWAVSEIAKHRTNQGEHGGMFFYRDQHGTEADLVIESADRDTVVEIKAGQTVSDDMLTAARRTKAAIEEAVPCRTVVAFGGQTRQERQDALALPWDQIDRESWTR